MPQKHLFRLFAPVCASLMIAQTVSAGPTAVSAAYPETIVEAIQDLGYKADVSIDSYGDPMIRSAAHGVGFAINFYGCEEGKDCVDLQFSVAFDDPNGMAYASMNSWNVEKVMGTAFLDDEMDPVLQQFVGQVDGMSRHNFNATFEFWVEVLGEFIDYIDW